MNYETTHKLGSHTPIYSLRLKGWLFWQAWLSRKLLQSAVAMRGANQRLAVCCTGVIDGGRGGVTNDIAV
jgi:hypothetical protein